MNLAVVTGLGRAIRSRRSGRGAKGAEIATLCVFVRAGGQNSLTPDAGDRLALAVRRRFDRARQDVSDRRVVAIDMHQELGVTHADGGEWNRPSLRLMVPAAPPPLGSNT